jgi:hypothetical protein
MDHLPHACERIDDGRVNLVRCKSHDFNHGLSNVGFHGQLKQALLNIQIPTSNNGKNHRGKFVILGLSTWTRATIRILQHFKMSRKCHIYIYLQSVLGINNLLNIHDCLFRKLCIQFYNQAFHILCYPT